MKKTVIVKKCKSHRTVMVIFSVAMFVVLTMCVFAMQTAAALLFYVPFFVIWAPMTIYFLTWQIRFEKSGIVRKVFFRESKKYSFAMLREVVKSFYASERNFTVRMYFVDGKVLQFRMDDENATQAVKTLLRHGSIKTL